MASEFDLLFCRAIRIKRAEAGYTQAAMADLLGLKLSTYKTYERRTPLPHDLLLRFCGATGVKIAQLFDIEYLRKVQPAPTDSEN